MVILETGCVCFCSAATSACPTSWYDTIRFSMSVRTVPFFLGARDDRLKRDEQILLVNGLPPEAHRAQRRLVHEVGQIRADGARRACAILCKSTSSASLMFFVWTRSV